MCERENLFPILLHLSCLHFHKNVQSLSPHLIHFPILTKTFSCYPLIWYFRKNFQLLFPYLIYFPMFTKNFQLLSPHLIHFQLLSPIWYFRKSIQSLSPHLIPFPILKSFWRPHMLFSKSKIMQKLNSIFIGKNHIFHNTMYQKIHIHEKLYNLDAQFC